MYRIYTEAVNVDETLEAVARKVDGFTATEGIGYWRGQSEPSLILDFVGSDAATVRDIAELIKRLNKQEAVLLVRIDNAEVLV